MALWCNTWSWNTFQSYDDYMDPRWGVLCGFVACELCMSVKSRFRKLDIFFGLFQNQIYTLLLGSRWIIKSLDNNLFINPMELSGEAGPMSSEKRGEGGTGLCSLPPPIGVFRSRYSRSPLSRPGDTYGQLFFVALKGLSLFQSFRVKVKVRWSSLRLNSEIQNHSLSSIHNGPCN